jgi:hypothetical protein
MALRRLPWLLLGASAVTLVYRFAVSDNDSPLRSLPMLAATVVVTLTVIMLWQLRLERQADELGRNVGALFTSVTAMQLQLFRQQPRFAQPLENVRLSWLGGRWLMGKVFVTTEGITYAPNAWTKAIFRVPAIMVPWTDIADAGAVDMPGPRDPGLLELRTTDGSSIAFQVTKCRKLAAVLDDLNRS